MYNNKNEQLLNSRKRARFLLEMRLYALFLNEILRWELRKHIPTTIGSQQTWMRNTADWRIFLTGGSPLYAHFVPCGDLWDSCLVLVTYLSFLSWLAFHCCLAYNFPLSLKLDFPALRILSYVSIKCTPCSFCVFLFFVKLFRGFDWGVSVEGYSHVNEKAGFVLLVR